ncbi:MAG: serine/threonine protein kinase [Cyanosarcina radialis HA8281-LM2]|jgi:WD40 repeat protein|nr:serine/threonine protein kinase [Cyanosarcina radialis HA8281-LM2]
MSYCLNPHCQKPQNLAGAKFCTSCGEKLLLGDRYRAIEAIARGGFGRTFFALDEQKPSKPPCAIKQFLPQAGNQQYAQKAAMLFHQEALRLDELGKHPQIPELLAYITQSSRQYLVQEFIEGQNLAQELVVQGCFNEIKIQQFLQDFLPLLQFIHSKQVIHRDIKPENIIRRSYPTSDLQKTDLVLVDFGAAKFSTPTGLARTGTAIGSIRYIAPEQAMGKAIFASDIYSLGVTCIQLLTNTDPLELYDTSIGEWVWRQQVKDNSLSDRLEQIIDRMLENATNSRYHAVEEILGDLQAVKTVIFASGRSLPNPLPNPALSSPSQFNSTLNTQHSTLPFWRCTRTLTGHTNWVNAIAFSPDGEILASGSADKTIKLWRVSDGELIHTFKGHSRSVRTVAFSPDGQILASGSADRTVKLWQVPSGKLIGNIKWHSGWVNAVAFSPIPSTLLSSVFTNGKTKGVGTVGLGIEGILASSSSDCSIAFWEIKTGKLLHTISGHSRAVTAAIYSPDGEVLISGGDDRTIKFWQLSSGRMQRAIAHHLGWINHLAISADGQILASATDNKAIELWQVSNGKLLQTLTDNSCAVYGVAFSPDGNLLASAGDDRTIKIWQVSSGKLGQTLTGHSYSVYDIAFSPNGQTIASCSGDKTIKLWRCDSV